METPELGKTSEVSKGFDALMKQFLGCIHVKVYRQIANLSQNGPSSSAKCRLTRFYENHGLIHTIQWKHLRIARVLC